jgi:hypothetical protein
MKENLNDIQDKLMQIHALAYLLKVFPLGESQLVDENSNKISDPLLSIAEIIMEKSELCIKKAEVIENKLNEHET